MQAKVYRIFTCRSEGDSILDLEGNLGAKVVPQALSDSGEIVDCGYRKLLKLVLWANSR